MHHFVDQGLHHQSVLQNLRNGVTSKSRLVRDQTHATEAIAIPTKLIQITLHAVTDIEISFACPPGRLREGIVRQSGDHDHAQEMVSETKRHRGSMTASAASRTRHSA